MTVQSVDSDEPVDKQKVIKIVCKLDKLKTWVANQILDRGIEGQLKFLGSNFLGSIKFSRPIRFQKSQRRSNVVFFIRPI